MLDFGLAKALDTMTGVSGRSQSPTLTSPAMTQAGVVLGTAAYMSPEQARGQNADKRSDVWAFGCVLYEMLTGTPPFAGDTVSDLVASVLRSDLAEGGEHLAMCRAKGVAVNRLGGHQRCGHVPVAERHANRGVAFAADERHELREGLGIELGHEPRAGFAQYRLAPQIEQCRLSMPLSKGAAMPRTLAPASSPPN